MCVKLKCSPEELPNFLYVDLPTSPALLFTKRNIWKHIFMIVMWKN